MRGGGRDASGWGTGEVGEGTTAIVELPNPRHNVDNALTHIPNGMHANNACSGMRELLNCIS